MKAILIAVLPPSDLTFAHDGGPEAAFTFPAGEDEAPRVVMVRTDGVTLRFFPERCAGHRDVLRALGL